MKLDIEVSEEKREEYIKIASKVIAALEIIDKKAKEEAEKKNA